MPGGFPTNVTDVKATSPTTLTMTMNKAYSPTWFTYNELSQITPIPKAWDRTASGPSNCTDNVSDCKAVYTYLDSQSKSMSTYASSPVWGVVDGPWKLTAFNADGNATFVPNKSYSGPVKPTLSEFKEVPFTTEAAEYNVLRSGNGSQKISVGYLPTTDAPKKPADATVGANPVPGYTLDPLYSWSINYFVPNIDSTTPEGPRHQAAVLPAGAGVPDQPGGGDLRPAARLRHRDGRAGRLPAGDQLPVVQGQAGRPVPLRPRQGEAAAVQPRLEGRAERDQHLHQPEPVRRGRQAGPGPELHPAVRHRHQLDRLGDDPAQVERLAGRHQPQPGAEAVQPGHCDRRRWLRRHDASCAWDFANWGGGWAFAPDYEPTGETLFLSGSAANSSGYTSSQNDSLIQQTLTSSSLTPLYNWQDYLQTQLPEMWQENGVYELTEIASNLHGVIPQSPTLNLNPENWYFTK